MATTITNRVARPEDYELVALVRAAQDGDREAQGALFSRFQPVVYAIAMQRLRNHAEAQELCQDVFLRAMTRLHQLETPQAFAGWLRSITVRMAINRAVRRAPLVMAEPETLEPRCLETETPLTGALAAERRREVRNGLERLGPLDRETLRAFYFRGQSILEMSDAFDSPVGTIKRRLHVARKRLARELADMAV